MIVRNKAYWVEKLGEDWTIALREILKSSYMDRLLNFLAMEGAFKSIYPTGDDIFKIFRDTPLKSLRLVVSYKEPGIDTSIFPMMRSDNYINTYHHANYTAIADCLNREYPDSKIFNFEHFPEEWINQGVLLLPRALTTCTQESGAHLVQWRRFYEAVLEAVVREAPGTIWFLWGDEVREYSSKLVNQNVFGWESPSQAVKENRDWLCPNFKQADNLIEKLNGHSFKITW